MAQSVGVFAALGALMGLFVLIGIALYVLFSFGLYTMAKNRNIENAWLAWIPIAQIYTLGEVIGPVKLGDFNLDKPGLYLLGAVIALWILAEIPAIGFIFSLAGTVICIGAFYYLFNRYTTENTPLLYIILSVVTLGLLAPVFVFMIRNNEYLTNENSVDA